MMKLALVLGMCGAMAWAGAAKPTCQRLESESFGKSGNWQVVNASWASGGKMLRAFAGHYHHETPPQAVRLEKPGRYQVAVRFWAEKDANSNFGVVVRDEALEVVRLEKIDWQRMIPSAKPYVKSQGQPKNGPAWQVFSFVAEAPGYYGISLTTLLYGGRASSRLVDCLLVGSSLPENLDALDAAALKKVPEAPVVQVPWRAPKNATYAGADSTPFHCGIINCATVVLDSSAQTYLGFNRDHGGTVGGNSFMGKQYVASGVKSLVDPFSSYRPDLDRKFPKPLGRYVNSDGEVGNTFSFHFKPYWDEIDKQAIETIKEWDKKGDLMQYSFSGEWGGAYDYSELAQKAFREYLQKKHGSLEILNQRWKTDYKTWDSVRPPKTLKENPAAYYDFQDFSGLTFAEFLGRRVDLIRKYARNKSVTSQLSNLNIFSAMKAMRPMDFQQIVRNAYKGSGMLGWDGYCADDYMGAEIDYLDSISGGLPLVNHETNLHTEDPDLLARTLWLNVGKGVKGLYLFMFQEGIQHDSYPKWAFLNPDYSHKEKLAAASDLVHEIHRLEPLLTRARRQPVVKPVFIYYSRLDSLYVQPLMSAWGEGPNSPYRVYELFRGLGYPVRYVTPEQIAEGKLAEAGALVLSQASVIPEETSRQIQDWIKKGGVAIADMQPGIKNQWDRTDGSLMALFGVCPVIEKASKPSSKLALQESTQGYGEVTISAIESKDIPSSVFEMYQQNDSRHPVLEGVSPFTFSGFGMQKVHCVGGEVIGMCFGGQPGVVVNSPGQGRTLYLAGMLGSVFGGACSTYEFSDAHAGASPYRLLGSFLKWAGCKPQVQIRLPEKMARKVRVEDPLVDPKGNVMIAMVNYNDGPLADFSLDMAWPDNWEKTTCLHAVTDGSRQLQKVPVRSIPGGLRITMPSFSTYGALMVLKNFGPVVSLACKEQGFGSLAQVGPGKTLSFTATVHALSEKPLKAGRLTLALPVGWKASADRLPIGAMAPGETRSVSFQVTAPPCRNLRRVRPVSLRFDNGEVTSTPATAMVWFD